MSEIAICRRDGENITLPDGPIGSIYIGPLQEGEPEYLVKPEVWKTYNGIACTITGHNRYPNQWPFDAIQRALTETAGIAFHRATNPALRNAPGHERIHNTQVVVITGNIEAALTNLRAARVVPIHPSAFDQTFNLLRARRAETTLGNQ